MKPPAFEYERPDNLRAALDLLAKHGAAAKILAGGQSLIPQLNARALSPSRLIDVSRLSELQYIADEAGTLRIGALTTHNTLLRSSALAAACPIIAEAYAHVGSHTVRNRGTFGGSLCHNDPTAEMPLVASVLGATMVARGGWGSRNIAAADFFNGAFETSLAANEMLVEIRFARPPAGHGYSFLEMSQRYSDRSLVAVASVLSIRYGVCADVRVGYRGVGAQNFRLRAVEAEVEGKPPSPSVVEAAAAALERAAQPASDMHASAEYRRDVAATLTRRALQTAFARAGRPLEAAPHLGRAS